MSKVIHGVGLEFAELERLRSRVGRLFAVLEEAAEMVAHDSPGAWLPPVDLCETESALIVYVELPGVLPEQVEVSLTNGQLLVSGTKRRAATRRAASHLCSERSYGRFTRIVHLRWPVRAGGARAELKDGLLTVWLPKLKERRGGAYMVQVTSGE